jgi:hypothetical protein
MPRARVNGIAIHYHKTDFNRVLTDFLSRVHRGVSAGG